MSRKLVKAKQKRKSAGQEIMESLLGYFMPAFAFLIFIILPLYMKDGYYKIGAEKYNAYAHLLVFGLPVLALLILFWAIYAFCDEKKAFSLHAIKQWLSIPDYWMLSFLVASFLSFGLSSYRNAAFWGYEGWYMGLFSQFTFVILYFLYSRFGMGWQFSISVLCAVSFYTFVIGILHRMMIDPIGVYANIDDYYKGLFLSTLGQASWYSSFICTVMPLGIVCFFLANKPYLRLLSGIYTLAGFTTMVSQNSDSAYIALAFVMAVLLFVAVESNKGMMRFFEVLFLFSASTKLMHLLLVLHPNPILSLDTLSEKLIFSNLSIGLMCLSVLGIVLFWGFDSKKKDITRYLKIARNCLYGLALFAVLLSVLVLWLGATGGLNASVLALTQKIPYLTFNDSWGNGRGFTWSATAKIYAEMPVHRKIFGVGPDCYASYAYEFYEDYIRSKWGDNVLQNAHNEWMNMLVNEGLVGAVTYLGIYVSMFVRFMKNRTGAPLVFAVACCIAAYVGHNIFCYQQVLCTPFIFLFMGMAEYQIRKHKRTE